MVTCHPFKTAFYGFMVVSLALLAGCLPRNTNPAAPVPTDLAATAGDTEVTLSWSASSGATGYNVKRSTASGGPYTLLSAPKSPGFTDSLVTNGTTYYYVVSSLNAAGESANSGQASATPAASSTLPAVPTNLAATAGDTTVALTWTASSGAKSYNVKRSTTNGGPYTTIATTATTTYTEQGLTNGTTFYYVVSAVNGAGESANSAQASAAPSGPPPNSFGTWTNVTPAAINLTASLCSNYGAKTVQVDPAHPSNLYVLFDCQGTWKSTDYGVTWTGPTATGATAAAAIDCSGGIKIPPGSTAAVPVIYQACIRGNGVGFWRSTDGGVTWTRYAIGVTSRQDYYPPEVDPYDPNHLLMTAHEFTSTVESVDGGQNWTSVSLNSTMQANTSPQIFFIDTGSATTTRHTWLYIGDQTGGTTGTWRTTDGGANWVQVDKNEHVGNTQIYQPDKSGVVFMAGNYSAAGAGVLRSTDFGQTWVHVGTGNVETAVIGTAKNVYAMYGFPVGIGGSVDVAFRVGAQPGTGTWASPATPSALNLEGVEQLAVTNDGTHSILVGGFYNAGLWRYIEP
jgi:hypothetical protein